MSPPDLRQHFDYADSNADGKIDLTEFQDLLIQLGLRRGHHVAEQVFAAIDQDGSGQIDFDEFERWWQQSEHQTDAPSPPLM